jgi:hypothetical protein
MRRTRAMMSRSATTAGSKLTVSCSLTRSTPAEPTPARAPTLRSINLAQLAQDMPVTGIEVISMSSR